MLAKREIVDPMTQKILCYATMMLLLIYFMKFVRHVAQRSCCIRVSNANNPPISCTSLPAEHSPRLSEEYNKHRKQKRRQHKNMNLEQLKREPSHSQDLYYED